MSSTSIKAVTEKRSRFMSILHTREASLVIIIFVVIIALSIIKPEAFLAKQNFIAMGNGMVFDLFTATSLTLALILWGIDLSVGSVLALTSVITAMSLRGGLSIPISIMLGLGVSVTCGAINGYLISRFKIAPFIVTLAMMSIAKGIAVVLTSGYYLSGLPDSFVAIGRGTILSIPIPVFIAALILIILGILMKKHNFFHQMYFVGNNPEASELSGINTKVVIMTGYIISSLLAGVAAVFMTSRLAMGFSGFGLLAEQRAIAAAVIGGASFSGGEGSIQGAVLGVCLLALINNGFVLLNGSPNWQQAVSGIILLVAVGVDAYRSRKGRKE
jgi:ribose/xylose/arabinose/galactoside ABC-type transport system permease subunit